jgi:hypothetical protein
MGRQLCATKAGCSGPQPNISFFLPTNGLFLGVRIIEQKA